MKKDSASTDFRAVEANRSSFLAGNIFKWMKNNFEGRNIVGISQYDILR